LSFHCQILWDKVGVVNLDACHIFDISPVISPRMAVFPGDTPFSAKVLLDMKQGHNLTLSSITTTVHIGAHTDAPNHYASDGLSMERRSLHFYLGSAQVLSAKPFDGLRLKPSDIKTPILAPRVLFKTGSYPDPEVWCNDFTALSAELIEFLAKQKVCLAGIDTPSIDPATAKVLESHHAVHVYDMAILEGINLSRVPDGLYQLIALPLAIEGADASPVRAILAKPFTSSEIPG
jgi:arylformamidase